MPRTAKFIFPAERQLLCELGARIRLARLRRKLAASAVARQAGISRTTLHGAESGDAAVTMGTYLRVLAAFGLEQDLARLAAEDRVGQRLQDLRVDAKPSMAMAGATNVRPKSLKAVVQFGRDHGDIDSFLREFLDEFYVARDPSDRAAMLADEPPLATDDRTNAYLGAVAEHLSLRNRLPVPPWTNAAARFLKRPFFPGGLESLKATLLMESPAAFRRRMIFVGADPLYRPRRDKSGIGP